VAYYKTLDEIITLHVLEPSLKSVYTEGVKDKKIVELFIGKKGDSSIEVYSVDALCIPKDMVTKYKLSPHSNKNRLITFSKELEGNKECRKVKIFCVVDKDYDKYLGKDYANSFLKYTDYTSMEMYCFNEKTVNKFISLILQALPVSAKEILENLTEILTQIFAIRLTNEMLGWGMEWLDVNSGKYLRKNGTKVIFNKAVFIDSYLLKNSKMGYKEDFLNKLEQVNGMVEGDSRDNIKGGDFPYLLRHVVRRIKTMVFAGDITIQRVLFACLEKSDLENEGLFRSISSFANRR